MRKILLAALALTTVAAAATSASAAPRNLSRAAAQAYASSPAVISDGVVVGHDTDAYVRLELLRSAGTENQG